MNGKIKWFNEFKNYGFITDENGKDIFFHEKQVLYEPILSGDEVTFDIEESRKHNGKMNAINVLNIE
jgi:cold shock protein